MAFKRAQQFFLTSFTSSWLGVPIPKIISGVSWYSKGGDWDRLWKNDGRGDQVWRRTTSVSGQDGEGFGVVGMDERGGLGDRSLNGSGGMVAFAVASARASSLWEGDVECPVA